MVQKLTGGALALIGTAPIGFAALDVTGVDPLFLSYGVLLVILGGGVYTDEIQFEQELYEGLIFLYAIVVVIILAGGFFITMA